MLRKSTFLSIVSYIEEQNIKGFGLLDLFLGYINKLNFKIILIHL